MAKRNKSTFERLQSERWSRKKRRELERRLYSEDPGLSVVHADAAGIDVGKATLWLSRRAGTHSRCESSVLGRRPSARWPNG